MNSWISTLLNAKSRSSGIVPKFGDTQQIDKGDAVSVTSESPTNELNDDEDDEVLIEASQPSSIDMAVKHDSDTSQEFVKFTNA